MESTFSSCAYCWKHEDSWESILSFKCEVCQKRVHHDCIQSTQPSSILDDTFFTFKCSACGADGKEEFERTNLSWLNVVMLVLNHLHKTSQGLCGFFHWRSHICGFIDRNWPILFGSGRKRTNLWLGTVAGTLSTGCPQFFASGANVVEQGYWRLANQEPPLPQKDYKLQKEKKQVVEAPVETDLGERRCRRVKESSLQAAIELKEKRSRTSDNWRRKKAKSHTPSVESSPFSEHGDSGQKTGKTGKGKSRVKKGSKLSDDVEEPVASTSGVTDASWLSDSQDNASLASSASSSRIHSMVDEESQDAKEDLMSRNPMAGLSMDDEESDLDIEIDVSEGYAYLPDLRPSSPDISSMLKTENEDAPSGKSPVSRAFQPSVEVKPEPLSDAESEGQSERDIDEKSDHEEEEEEGDSEEEEGEEGEEENDEEEDDEEEDAQSQAESEPAQTATQGDGEGKVHRKRGRPRKRRREDDSPPPSPPARLERISLFEEGELLQRLNQEANQRPLTTELAQLRRKLICNQTNREFGLPVFDLEREIAKLTKKGMSVTTSGRQEQAVPTMQTKAYLMKETRDLDRFMMPCKKKTESRQYTRFHQRLVGLQDHELQPVISPYTTRVLLPFIWRNYHPSRKPLKMRLLEEIKAYPHRNDPSWQPEPSPPIDYCYVRPEHIPSVNALSREFFWPGIDMSECLQYPDFSCVVLFRKIVIAFAFMVPDRGYNEAYISFIFTHPEWRGAGIATFMIYHLIQTCMGKDVVLHVSVSNPAVLLYQKFGFKAEEFNVNFYHKYFPLNAPDSLHAYLMRLSR